MQQKQSSSVIRIVYQVTRTFPHSFPSVTGYQRNVNMFVALYANMYLSLDYAVSLVLLNAGMDNKLHLESILNTKDGSILFSAHPVNIKMKC